MGNSVPPLDVLDSWDEIGSYEVVGALGAGGMGEVYRARDTRLDRQVAIKVLPRRVASEPDRLARFEREAKVLATLNHPTSPRSTASRHGGTFQAIVMELVEGPDPQERLAQGPLEVPEALHIARRSPRRWSRRTSSASSTAI